MGPIIEPQGTNNDTHTHTYTIELKLDDCCIFFHFLFRHCIAKKPTDEIQQTSNLIRLRQLDLTGTSMFFVWFCLFVFLVLSLFLFLLAF